MYVQRAPLEAELVACVGQSAADVVLSLLTLQPSDRLSAEAALSLPFFSAERMQPPTASLADSNRQSLVANDSVSMQHLRPLPREEAGVKPSPVTSAGQVSLAVSASAHCSVQPGTMTSSQLQPDNACSSEAHSCERLPGHRSSDSTRNAGSHEAHEHLSNGVSIFSHLPVAVAMTPVTSSGAMTLYVLLHIAQQ